MKFNNQNAQQTPQRAKALDANDLHKRGQLPQDPFEHAIPAEPQVPPTATDSSDEAAGHERDVFLNGWKLSLEGLFVFLDDGTKPLDKHVSDPLRVIAISADETGNDPALVVETIPRLKAEWKRTVLLPIDELGSDGKKSLERLLAGHFRISAVDGRRQYLLKFLRHSANRHDLPVITRVVSAGWHADGLVYLLPNGEPFCAAEAGEASLMLRGQPRRCARAGTFEGWRAEVAGRARGNPALLMAISLAFAGPLLHACDGLPSVGLHLFGGSSKGKSTALACAASVYGHPETFDEGPALRWNATTNALGALAATRGCDGLLVLDEVAQADGDKLSEAIYTLGNGMERARMRGDLSLARSATWRVALLSAGEMDVESGVARGKTRIKAGQDVRLPSVPIEELGRFGAFENLHGFAEPGELANALKRSTLAHHGHVIGEWLRYLVTLVPAQRKALLETFVADFVKRQETRFKGGSSQFSGEAQRVARSFGLIAFAGELATEADLTGWAPGEATHAAQVCLEAWLRHRGGAGSKDRTLFLQHMRRLFAESWPTQFAFRDNSFCVGPGPENRSVRDPLGYVDSASSDAGSTAGGAVVYVLKDRLEREVKRAGAPSFKVGLRWLAEAGALEPGERGTPQAQRLRVPALGSEGSGGAMRCWLYQLNRAALLSSDDDGEA